MLDAADALAEALWRRATRDDAFLAGAAEDLLLGIVDGEGRESVWVESQPIRRTSDQTGDAHGSAGLNFRKRISRHVAEADAVTAALACWPSYRSTFCDVDWLVVIAVDRADEVGYLARVTRDGDGSRIVGARETWSEPNRAPFKEGDITQVLDSARAIFPTVLREGLHVAAKRRRRQARRR